MQLRFWEKSPERRPSRPPTVDVLGRTFPVEICRHQRARRYVLRMTSAGTLRLTVPRGASIAGGVKFAETQTEWIAREWTRNEARRAPWAGGTLVWYRGQRHALELGARMIAVDSLRVRIPRPPTDIRSAVEATLRDAASEELPMRAHALAASVGRKLVHVSVRNQRSRWGACSTTGRVTLNWRLIQMPPDVSDYVIFHEIAHLSHPNHSRRFWREVERLCPEWRDAERWLRHYGRELL